MISLKNKPMYIGFIITIIVSCIVFYDSFLFAVWLPTTQQHWVSDVPVHAQFTLLFSTLGHFPAYTMWYRLVQIMSGFSLQFNRIAFTTIGLLTILVGIKYLINYWLLKTSSANTKLIALISLAMIFVMPILSYYTALQHPGVIVVNSFHIYLGNIAANQWHNSTLILAMPLNLLLFYYSVKNIESPRLTQFLLIGLFSVVTIFCKPNYVLALLPALSIVIFIVNIRQNQYLKAIIKPLILVLPAMIALLYQWYYTFISNSLFEHATATIISPFLVWRTYSPYPFFSLLLSIAFPLTVFLFYYRQFERYLLMSWLVFLFALGMFSFLAEYPNHTGGNYWWGSIAANYILFLFSAKLLLEQPFNWKAKIAYGIFSLHFLSGCFLLLSFMIKQQSLVL